MVNVKVMHPNVKVLLNKKAAFRCINRIITDSSEVKIVNDIADVNDYRRSYF